MQCTVDGCDNKSASLKMCDKHYQRFKKHGTTELENAPELHGMRHTLEYRIWAGIKTRCFNSRHKSYRDYGARGITMSDRWRNSFVAFYEDMGPIPTQKHSIERNDVNGNYERSNCRWATKWEQAINVQSRRVGSVPGVYYHKDHKKWCARLLVNKEYVLSKRFDTLEEAAAARREAEIKWLGKPLV